MNTPTRQTEGESAHATLRQFLDRFVREADGLTGETVLSTYEIQPSPLDMCEAMEALEALRAQLALASAKVAEGEADRERLAEIRTLIDAYERDYLNPRQLSFGGMLLPNIVRVARTADSSAARTQETTQ